LVEVITKIRIKTTSRVSRRTGSIQVREGIWTDSARNAENIATKINIYTH